MVEQCVCPDSGGVVCGKCLALLAAARPAADRAGMFAKDPPSTRPSTGSGKKMAAKMITNRVSMRSIALVKAVYGL